MPTLNVVALATNVPGPLAAEALARDGAKVVKVEPPSGDPLETAAPAWYRRTCEPLSVLRLDLKNAAARRQFDGFLTLADLLITTVRPAALGRLGLLGSDLRAAHPQLCHVAIVGDAGAAANHAGHDLTYQALSGLLSPPAMPRTVYADMFAAKSAIAAAYKLLYSRAATNEAGYAEIAIAAGAADLGDALRFGLTSPDGPLGGAFDLYGLYETADGWIALAALEPHFQNALVRMLGADAFDRDRLQRIFSAQPSGHWEELALTHDVPLCAVRA